MPSPETAAAFSLASLVLLVIPGPAVTYIGVMYILLGASAALSGSRSEG